jgi:hypothetical protein
MTIESQSQLINPRDRNERRVEKVQDLLNKKQLPDTFDAYVFIDHQTESLAQAAKSSADGSAPAETSQLYCRVYNEKIFDASKVSPLDAKTTQQYKHSINACPQGAIRSDNHDLGSLTNGSIWVCKMNDGIVDLISLKQASGFTFSESTGGLSRTAFGSGKKMPLGNRLSQSAITVVFADDAPMRAQLRTYPQYSTFLNEFTKRLSATSFSHNSVVVNSMFRSATDQARAMARTRYTKPADYNAFLAWYMTEYGEASKKAREIQAVIRDNKGKTPQAMEAALVAKLKEQVKNGDYLSKHMQNGAFDFQTRKFGMQDVEIMLGVLAGMKADKFITYYNWEGVWSYNTGIKGDTRKNRKIAGLAKRRSDGKLPNEHIHLNITSSGTGGE